MANGVNYQQDSHCLHGHDLRLPGAISVWDYTSPSGEVRQRHACTECHREQARRRGRNAAAARARNGTSGKTGEKNQHLPAWKVEAMLDHDDRMRDAPPWIKHPEPWDNVVYRRAQQ